MSIITPIKSGSTTYLRPSPCLVPTTESTGQPGGPVGPSEHGQVENTLLGVELWRCIRILPRTLGGPGLEKCCPDSMKGGNGGYRRWRWTTREPTQRSGNDSREKKDFREGRTAPVLGFVERSDFLSKGVPEGVKRRRYYFGEGEGKEGRRKGRRNYKIMPFEVCISFHLFYYVTLKHKENGSKLLCLRTGRSKVDKGNLVKLRLGFRVVK